MNIILYLLHTIQYQQRIIRYLFPFICRYIPPNYIFPYSFLSADDRLMVI